MQSSSLFPASEGDKSPLLSNGSSAGHHLDTTSSSRLERKPGVVYLSNKTSAARFGLFAHGFFSHDSLKTVSTLVIPAPPEVVCMFSLQLTYHLNSLAQTSMQQMRSTNMFGQSSGVDDRSLAVRDSQ